MPAVALSRAGARVVESGPGGQDLAAGAWERLEALRDPALAAGAEIPLACLVAVAVCAFTAAGNDRLTAVGQGIRRASQADLARLRARGNRWPGGTGCRMRRPAVAQLIVTRLRSNDTGQWVLKRPTWAGSYRENGSLL